MNQLSRFAKYLDSVLRYIPLFTLDVYLRGKFKGGGILNSVSIGRNILGSGRYRRNLRHLLVASGEQTGEKT